MITVLIIIYAAGCLILGFVMMRKYDRFLNRLDSRYGLQQIEKRSVMGETTEKSETTGSADFAETAQFAEKQNRLQQEKQ